ESASPPDLVPRRIAEREAARAAPPPAPAAVAPVESPREPATPLSVAEVVARVRDHLHAAFRFPLVVQGEASNVRRPRAGHLYFTLKDRRAQLRVVVFAANVALLPVPVEEGAQVVVTGQITAYMDA